MEIFCQVIMCVYQKLLSGLELGISLSCPGKGFAALLHEHSPLGEAFRGVSLC